MPEEIICNRVKQLRRRLEALKSNPLYWFDDASADRAVKFIEANLTHHDDVHYGKRFLLSPWQANDIIRPLFGWRLRGSNVRLFREAFIQVSRKNGKSPLASAILATLLFTGPKGQHLYTCATSASQARIVFDDIVKYIQDSKALSKRVEFRGKRYITEIKALNTDSTLAPLSSDTKRSGLRINGAVVDELHEHPDDLLHNLIITATQAKEETLVLKITTAGADNNSLCRSQYDYASKILDGTIEADRFFCYVAEADPDDAWDSREAYIKANPNLGVSALEENILIELQKAKDIPGYRQVYEQFYLDRWVEGGAQAFVKMDKWNGDCAREKFTREDFLGREIVCGLDLSKREDLTAFVGLTVPANDKEPIYVLPWFFLPAGNIKHNEERDKLPYTRWSEPDKRFIELTDGNGGSVLDADYVSTRILEISKQYKIREIHYDKYDISRVAPALESHGLALFDFIQGPLTYHPVLTLLHELVSTGRLQHGGNPILRVHASNLKIKYDPSEKMRPVKEYASSPKRIDGIVALCMALQWFVKHGQGKGREIDYSAIPKNIRALIGA